MKKKNLIICSVLLLALASCQNEAEIFNIEDMSPKGITSCTFDVSFPESETRTAIDGLDVQWVQGDELGVFCGGIAQNTPNVKFEVTEAGSFAKIQSVSEMLWLFDANTFVYGYYPYNSEQTSDNVLFSLPSVQEQNSADAHQLSVYDYLVATPVACQAPSVSLKFNHLMTWLDFVLKNTDDKNMTVFSVDIIDSDGTLVLNGIVNVAAAQGNVDFLAVKPISTTGKLSVSATGEGWNTIASGESVTLRMALFPCNMEGRNFRFVAHTDLGDFELEKNGRNLLKGLRYTVSIPLFFPVLNVENPILTFLATSGSDICHFETNMSWSIDDNLPSWISVDNMSGSKSSNITVSVQENPGKDSRSAELTLRAGELVRTITINQNGKDSSDSAGGGAEIPGQGEGGEL